MILLGGTILSFFGFYWIATAPDIDLENLKYIESSIIVDKDGHFYQELQGKEKRKAVGIDQIPEQVQFAFIAIEDERFYTHQGIDLKGITRAVLNIVKKRSLRSGRKHHYPTTNQGHPFERCQKDSTKSYGMEIVHRT